MITNAVLIFTVFTIFGNEHGVQCLEFKEYLSFDIKDIDMFNHRCHIIILYNINKNMDNRTDDFRELGMELLKYYLRSLRVLFPSDEGNWRYEFYRIFNSWIEHGFISISQFNDLQSIIDNSRISEEILSDDRHFNICKETLDSICTPTMHFETSIKSTLLLNQQSSINYYYILKNGYILLLMNERESQTFNSLIALNKNNKIITILNDALVNIFDIMNSILKSLNVSGIKRDLLNPQQQHIMMIFENIFTDIIKAANFVFKLQVWYTFPSYGRRDLLQIGRQKILQYYKNFILNLKINWTWVPNHLSSESEEEFESDEIESDEIELNEIESDDEQAIDIRVTDRITIENGSNIKPSMFGCSKNIFYEMSVIKKMTNLLLRNITIKNLEILNLLK